MDITTRTFVRDLSKESCDFFLAGIAVSSGCESEKGRSSHEILVSVYQIPIRKK